MRFQQAIHHPTSPTNRGFTLAEMIVSSAIMSILAVGITSAVLVSVRAVADQKSQIVRTQTAGQVSNQMSMEISTAVDVSETAANAITFNVPDRNGDGEAEQIQYAWSGVAGDPLHRTCNSEPISAMLENVRAFTLTYKQIQTIQTGAANEYFVAGHSAASGLSNYRPSNYNWVFQSFVPNLPAGATGWRLNRISLYGKISGSATGQITIELRNALSDGRPGSTLICQTIVPESDFPSSHSWRSIVFRSDACTSGNIAPGQAVCLLIRGNVSDSCELRYHNKNVTLATYKFGLSNSAGGYWSIRSYQALLFEAHGRVAGINANGGGPMRLAAVNWQLAAGDDLGSQVDGGAQIPNLPEAPQ